MKTEKYIDTVSGKELVKNIDYIDYEDDDDKDIILKVEYYLLNDIFHREDGPALIYYKNNGDLFNKHYYLNGQQIRDDFKISEKFPNREIKENKKEKTKKSSKEIKENKKDPVKEDIKQNKKRKIFIIEDF